MNKYVCPSLFLFIFSKSFSDFTNMILSIRFYHAEIELLPLIRFCLSLFSIWQIIISGDVARFRILLF